MGAYQRALLLTGGAANATASTLDLMARRTGEVTATQGKAAEVLAQMASTGQISRAQLQQSAEAAVRMERMLGVEVEKTVGAFAQLGRDPVQAAARLNQQYNFLTLSVWEQIRALEKQGRTQEATAVAQEALAKTGIERSKEMERNLGTLQTGWLKITDAAKSAWDAMLGIGRQATVEQQLADVQARLAAPLRRGVDPGQQEARREGLRQREAELQEALRLQQRQADMQAAAARNVQEQIDADQKKDRGPKAADPYQALNSQISQRLILASAELQAGEKLSALDRERLTLAAQIAEAERKGDAAGAQALRGRADVLVYLLRLNEERRQQEEDAVTLERQFQADRQQAVQLAQRELMTTQQQLDATMEETAQIGLNAQALAMRAMAQADSAIADKEARLERISGLPAYAEEAALLEQQIRLLRQLRDAKLVGAYAKIGQDERRQNKDRSEAMAQSIEQGLLTGFRNGQDFASIFLRELKAQFAAAILRPRIQFVADATSSDIARAIGFVGSLFGGGDNVGAEFKTGSPMPGFDRPGEGFHEGGVVGNRPTFTRMLPSGAWNGAMRRHGGGLAQDEVPAILKRKEGVFTEDQMKALAPVGPRGQLLQHSLGTGLQRRRAQRPRRGDDHPATRHGRHQG